MFNPLHRTMRNHAIASGLISEASRQIGSWAFRLKFWQLSIDVIVRRRSVTENKLNYVGFPKIRKR